MRRIYHYEPFGDAKQTNFSPGGVIPGTCHPAGRLARFTERNGLPTSVIYGTVPDQRSRCTLLSWLCGQAIAGSERRLREFLTALMSAPVHWLSCRRAPLGYFSALFSPPQGRRPPGMDIEFDAADRRRAQAAPGNTRCGRGGAGVEI